VLLYDSVDNFRQHRTPLRTAHLALASRSHVRGEMVMGGACRWDVAIGAE